MLTLMFLGLSEHALDLLLTQTTHIIRDNDLVRLVSRLVSRGDVDDVIRIDVEGDLDLRYTTEHR